MHHPIHAGDERPRFIGFVRVFRVVRCFTHFQPRNTRTGCKKHHPIHAGDERPRFRSDVRVFRVVRVVRGSKYYAFDRRLRKMSEVDQETETHTCRFEVIEHLRVMLGCS